MTIFKHYLWRSAIDPIGLLIFILLPVMMVFLNVEINIANVNFVGGEERIATNVIMTIMLMFQLMAGTYVAEYVCSDLKGETRWRLLAAPVSMNKYLFSAMGASLLITLISGALILGLGFFVYNIYLGNLGFVLAAMVLTALFGQFLGLILGMLFKKSSTCTAMHIGISWVIFIVSGFFGSFSLPVVGDILTTYGTPFSAGTRAVLHSGAGFAVFEDGELVGISTDTGDAFLSLGILAGFVAVAGIAAWIVGRRKPL